MLKIKSDAETDCRCQCLPYMDTYREDLGICVDDIHGELLYNTRYFIFLIIS